MSKLRRSRSPSLKKQLGDFGERATARYLRKRGFLILERQYRTRYGEIDIIAYKRRVLHFIEVKTRAPSIGFPDGMEAVTERKQQRIIQSADRYQELYAPKLRGMRCRGVSFDIVSIEARLVIRRPAKVFREETLLFLEAAF